MKKDIINTIRDYKAGFITKREVITEISKDILNIPKYFGYCSNDLIHDFYAVIISKIEKILSVYREVPYATFSTWFNHVIKLEFFAFVKQYNKNELDCKEYPQDKIPSCYDEDESSELVNKIKSFSYDFLTDKERKILVLKFGILEDDLNNSESLQIILGKLNKKRRIEDKIALRYSKIITLQKKIILEIDCDVKNELREKLEKVKAGKRRLEKIFEKLILLPTNEWVGAKLGISKNTIATFLSKIKKKISAGIAEAEYSA